MPAVPARSMPISACWMISRIDCICERIIVSFIFLFRGVGESEIGCVQWISAVWRVWPSHTFLQLGPNTIKSRWSLSCELRIVNVTEREYDRFQFSMGVECIGIRLAIFCAWICMGVFKVMSTSGDSLYLVLFDSVPWGEEGKANRFDSIDKKRNRVAWLLDKGHRGDRLG
jgi:hypothetical protein